MSTNFFSKSNKFQILNHLFWVNLHLKDQITPKIKERAQCLVCFMSKKHHAPTSHGNIPPKLPSNNKWRKDHVMYHALITREWYSHSPLQGEEKLVYIHLRIIHLSSSNFCYFSAPTFSNFNIRALSCKSGPLLQ